jgi:hypothetical protein
MKKSAKQGARSAPLTPHLEFVNRMAGRFPEAIAESDQESLNLALGFLFESLRKARRLYDQEQDGGRAAALMALGGMWQFIALFKAPLAELLHVPILNLQDALAALENNNVLPILKPVKRVGRAASSHAYTTLKGHAAGTVQRLLQVRLERRLAFRAVANALAKQGIRAERGSGAVTATTVRHWCDEVASDVGRRGTAAMMYDSMFTDIENNRFSELPPDQAQLYALGSLGAWVQEMICPTGSRRKNPVNPPI